MPNALSGARPVQLAHARPSDVVVYRDGAEVTREVGISLRKGLYELEFQDLPKNVDGKSISIVVDNKIGSTCGDVRYLKTGGSVETGPRDKIDSLISKMDAGLAELAEENVLLDKREHFLTAATGTLQTGTDTGDRLADSRAQRVSDGYKFLFGEYENLLSRRRNLKNLEARYKSTRKALQDIRENLKVTTPTKRTATGIIEVSKRGLVKVSLVYRVKGAEWYPVYRVHAVKDPPAATLRYDAIVIQATGEDWKNVKLSAKYDSLFSRQPRAATERATDLQPLAPAAKSKCKLASDNTTTTVRSFPAEKQRASLASLPATKDGTVKDPNQLVFRAENHCDFDLPSGNLEVYIDRNRKPDALMGSVPAGHSGQLPPI